MSRTRISVVLGALAALALAACSSDDDPSLSTGESTIVASSTAESGATTTAGAPADSDTTTTTGATDGSTAGSTEGSTVESATSTTSATGTTIPRVVDDPSDDVHGGDTGPGVEQIQFILKANGYDLPVDGQFGPVTELAVRDFQKKNGLKEDGIVGPITWSRLQASVGTTTTVSAGTNATDTTAAGDGSATSTTA